MPKQQYNFSSLTSDCDSESGSTTKRCKSLHIKGRQQRNFLHRVAPSGGQKEFEACYEQYGKLGRGGFGDVFAGIRKSDYLSVAIKHVLMEYAIYIQVYIEGELYNIPNEVYMMVKAAGSPEKLGQSASITLLEWFELDDHIVLILERPKSSMDLMTFMYAFAPLAEDLVKEIMKQLVIALMDLHNRRVFHRDIKANNILIETLPEDLRVRIIDFGCSCNVSSTYSAYSGTMAYAPPELFLKRQYNDIKTSMWQLGALTYDLIKDERDEDFTTIEWICAERRPTREVTKECLDFLDTCLVIDWDERMTLEQLSQHPWLLSAKPIDAQSLSDLLG